MRCQSSEIEVYISWGPIFGSDSPLVTSQAGDHEAKQEKWNKSTDGMSIFYPGPSRPFIKELMGADRLVIILAPNRKAVFDLAGIENVAPEVLACNLDLPTPTPVPPAETAYLEGVALGSEEKVEKALEKFDLAIRLDPQHVRAYHARGITYKFMGQYERAIEDYGEAIRLEPSHKLHGERGDIYVLLNQLDFSIEEYDEAIRLSCCHHFGRNGHFISRGVVYLQLGKYQQSVADFANAILGNWPERKDEAHALRAIAYTHIGNDSGAGFDIEKAAALGFDWVKLEQEIEDIKRRR